MKAWRSPHEGGDALALKTKKNALLYALAFGTAGFLVQCYGSYVSGSLALASDTAHLFADNASLFVSLFAVWASTQSCDHKRSFGLFRMEVLASFANGVLLFVVAAGILWEAFQRIRQPHMILPVPLLKIAALGLFFNLCSAFVLMRAVKGHHHGHEPQEEHHGHHHHHGHSHGHEDRNLRGALLHVLSDAVGSVAVMGGAVIIYYTGMESVDAWIGLALGLVVAHWAWQFLRDTVSVLLESTPKHVNSEKLLEGLRMLDDRILRVDDLHVWEITSNMYASSMEIVAPESLSLKEADEVRIRVNHWLLEKYGIKHAVTVLKTR